nr:MAG TPA: nucelotide kinase [Caudoviricetes sp.]
MVENSESRIAHPAHYQTSNGLETIDVMEAFTEDMAGYEAVCTSNVLKYICRWKKKNGLEDLKKAEWYLKRLIERIESSEAVVYSADGKEYRFTK